MAARTGRPRLAMKPPLDSLENRMRWPIPVAVLVVSPWLAPGWAGAQPPTVDQVIARYVEAIGGAEKIQALSNLVYTEGQYQEGDYTSSGTAAMSRARPYFKLVGSKEQPGGYMEGYDGAAWEWFADPGVVVRTVGPASAAIRHYAGVESPLVNYRAKGSTAVLKGEVEIDGASAAVIELTRRDGFAEQFYIDRSSWLIVASGHAAPIHAFGEDVTRLTRISDYRPVAGVLVAHRFVSAELPSGRELSSMQWGKIEGNRDLPEGWFSPPTFTRTPLQHLVEQLYGQRSDIDAVLWTYDEYRRAYPETEISAAAGFAGYQMLKMGAVDEAVALLSRSVEDYPVSADARFGLGRALRAAQRGDEARDQFEQALRIDPEHARARAALAEMNADEP